MAAVEETSERIHHRSIQPFDPYLTSNPIITSNWNASSGQQRWLVPFGGGLGRTFDFAGWTVAVALNGYWNAIRPEGAPHSLFRLDFVVPILAKLIGRES